MITVITGAAVAFFQSTRVERFVSRNYADLARAQLAAESGYAMAASLIRLCSANDHFIVVQNTNRQLFLGLGSNQAATSTVFSFNYVPLFSHSTNITNYSTNQVVSSAANPFTNVPNGLTFVHALPGGLTSTSPSVAWVILTNSTGRTNARFAFWVEDLAGRLDLSVAGSTGTNARRPTGTNPEELAVWALFNPSVELDEDNAIVRNLTNSRLAIVTPATARVLDSNNISTNLLANLAANLIHDTNEPEVIPFGFGYTNQGQLKPNLNRLITTNTAVTNIADHILANLPNFTNRAGGFMLSASGGATNTNAYTGLAYVQTLAASMVDYADADSDPTTDGTPLSTNRARPVYRGVDSYPFVNEINKRYRLISTNTATVGGINGRMARVEVTDFIELWNPSFSRSNATGNVTFVIAHRQAITYGFLNSSYTNPTSASNGTGPVFGGVTTNTFPNISIPPNGFVTLACSPVTNEFFNPTTVGSPIFSNTTETNLSSYWVAWNGRFYDAALGGIYRNGGTLADTTTILNRANLPGFIYRTISPPGFGNPSVGDPRATLYLSRNLDANQYVGNSTFGGRNVRAATVQPIQPYYEVAPATWPDGGHNSPQGNPAPNDDTLPNSVAPASYTNIPPARISNAGFYADSLELGAVFDPIQWRDPSLGSSEGKYTNLSTAGLADNGYGGGNTLRIGRAEHPAFTNNGLRAAQLLDLFGVNTNTAATNAFTRVAGKINLNTARPEVLRALAAGVVHIRDASLNPRQTNYVISTNAVAAFITGVTNYRNNKPFFSAAELPQITNGPGTYPANAVFGSRGFANVTAWNDAAAEEWFAKIYPLATVRSRNFLVHVVAQAMTTNTNFTSRPLATTRRMFQLYAEPIRNSSGLTTNTTVRLVHSWTLP